MDIHSDGEFEDGERNENVAQKTYPYDDVTKGFAPTETVTAMLGIQDNEDADEGAHVHDGTHEHEGAREYEGAYEGANGYDQEDAREHEQKGNEKPLKMSDPLFWKQPRNNKEDNWARDFLNKRKKDVSVKMGLQLIQKVIDTPSEDEAYALEACITTVMIPKIDKKSEFEPKDFCSFLDSCSECTEDKTFQRGDDIATAWASYVYHKTRQTDVNTAVVWAKNTTPDEMSKTFVRGFYISDVRRKLQMIEYTRKEEDEEHWELMITAGIFFSKTLRELLEFGKKMENKIENKIGKKDTWVKMCEQTIRENGELVRKRRKWNGILTVQAIGHVLAGIGEEMHYEATEEVKPFTIVEIFHMPKKSIPRVVTIDSCDSTVRKYIPDNVVDMVKDGNCFVFYHDGTRCGTHRHPMESKRGSAGSGGDPRPVHGRAGGATQDQRAAEQAAATQDQRAAEQAAATQDQAPGLNDMSVDAQPAGGHSNPVSAASSPGASSDDWRARVDDLKQEENEYEALQKERKIYDDMIQVDEQLRKKANVISSRKIEMAPRAQEELEALKKQTRRGT